jgi:hypothetical protein
LQGGQIGADLPARLPPEAVTDVIVAVDKDRGFLDTARREPDQASVDDGPAESLLPMLAADSQVI